jgi:hypothetical protein
MALYWIGYDLSKSGSGDYVDLIRHLAELGGYRILESDWLLPSNNKDASEIFEDLLRFLDDKDRILVSPVTNIAAWRNLKVPDNTVAQLYARFA